jgi:hypothetical protein
MDFYELCESNVLRIIPKNATGTYLLANKKNGCIYVKYTGRSDTRLQKRLLDHVKVGKYSYFTFFITETILEAYKIECREWHNAVDLDNKIHPRKPKNLNYKCPYCKKKNGGFREWEIHNKK